MNVKIHTYKSVTFVTAVCFGLLLPMPLLAGSNWLSSVTTVTNGNVQSQLPSDLSGLITSRAGGISSESIFNISISLQENPEGDDVYTGDANDVEDEQNMFEKKIEEFSDAVFQMTNGKHKIGRVTIFRSGDQLRAADVQWIEDCKNNPPRADLSGFGVPGRQIYFCTIWSGSTLMDTPKGAGFTLAHEWGHYAYGLYDEHIGTCDITPDTDCLPPVPRSTDTASVPSIMNNQWNAAGDGGDADWLEFSTDGIEPYNNSSDGNGTNAHARVFGESAWATLTRDPADDPKLGNIPDRTQYSNLVAPPEGVILVNDDESSARSELNIVWAGEQVVELMIDTSGSMIGLPLENAKTAATMLVGQLTRGKTAVGVGRFSFSANQVFPITDIPSPGEGADVQIEAQTAIADFSASGGTDIEAAALTALSEVTSFEEGSRPSVVFLLTDGMSFVNVDNVVQQYTAAAVPLVTFGFGTGVDSALLQELANRTGGQYFFSPTSLAQILEAFFAANSAFSSSTIIASSDATVAGSSTDVRIIPLDSTLEMANLSVTYALTETDISLRLLNGDGDDTGIQFVCMSSFEVSCEAQVDVEQIGSDNYGVEITNNTDVDKEVSILASGSPQAFESIDVAIQSDDVAYPDALTIRASVSREAKIAGLDVFATVTKPDGTEFELDMFDDGENSDLVADDGVYSIDLPYDQDGTYNIVVMASNESGNAETTFEGLAISAREDGTGVTPQRDSIAENFMRVAIASVTVSDFQADDHSGDPTAPTACTTIADDNLDTVARIDGPGDSDCFFFIPSDTSIDLFARATSLREDMMPVLRIYDSTGTNLLITADLANSTNQASGVIAPIPIEALDPAGHVITINHAVTSAEGGGYSISVGSVLISDETESGDNGGGGGGNPLPEPPDVQAPTAPEGFRFAVYSSTAAELFWNRSSDNGKVVGYQITRNGVLVETRDATSFFDSSLSPGVVYTYTITAVDDEGNLSPTQTESFSTQGSTVPSGPSVPPGFRFAVYSSTAAELFWNRSSDDGRVVGYEITRNGTLVTSRDATSYFDDTLSLGTVFTYQITAVDDEGNRSGTSTVEFTTGGDPGPGGNPSVPTGFRSIVYSSTAAELFWNRSVDDGRIEGYEIRRDGVLVETRDASSYFDDTLSAGNTYSYEIISIDDEGNRSSSNSLSVTID